MVPYCFQGLRQTSVTSPQRLFGRIPRQAAYCRYQFLDGIDFYSVNTRNLYSTAKFDIKLNYVAGIAFVDDSSIVVADAEGWILFASPDLPFAEGFRCSELEPHPMLQAIVSTRLTDISFEYSPSNHQRKDCTQVGGVLNIAVGSFRPPFTVYYLAPFEATEASRTEPSPGCAEESQNGLMPCS
ncbi:hypothetical protein HGRIS_001290 [Hohenbuehelia grisea]|uniref:Uncharacterized protein n=1 Tax=Hohenbuehelia grisea TaxID=104357 RepID=A0ABR3JQ93_9AGAR